LDVVDGGGAVLTPKARGPLSEALFARMTGARDDWDALTAIEPDDPDDAQVALWAMYELHYRGLDDVDESLEWHPDLLRLRRRLELDLEARLRERFAQGLDKLDHPEGLDKLDQPEGLEKLDHPEGKLDQPGGPDLAEFPERFFDFVAQHDGPSLAARVQRDCDREQVLDLLRMRSVYHLKEADATSWVIPRLTVRPKAALVELQFDEYGVGDPNRLHSHMFAAGLADSGLSPEYGAYVDDAPYQVLEQNNAMSLFGLHRRLRGAALGHLAAFEVTSSQPARRMSQGLSRLGFPASLVAYYDEHVLADAVHEQQAVRDICGALLAEEPGLVGDVFLGAFSCLDLEDRVAHRVLAEWGMDD
jgi:hypothetical protein